MRRWVTESFSDTEAWIDLSDHPKNAIDYGTRTIKTIQVFRFHQTQVWSNCTFDLCLAWTWHWNPLWLRLWPWFWLLTLISTFALSTGGFMLMYQQDVHIWVHIGSWDCQLCERSRLDLKDKNKKPFPLAKRQQTLIRLMQSLKYHNFWEVFSFLNDQEIFQKIAIDVSCHRH